MTATLCIIFLLSGAAALIFELLWFQLAGIAFGNSVWASSIVLASFMGGLALGNGLTALKGDRISNPIRFYSMLEIFIAAGGLCIVLLLPKLAYLLSSLFRVLYDVPLILNTIRLLIAFLLMLVPATAMGATLPVLVKALYKRDQNYGKILGALYGWNTLGAFTGVLAAELFLTHAFGIKGSAIVACICNIFAASLALYVYYKNPQLSASDKYASTQVVAVKTSLKMAPLLLSSFLCGLILLALEVIWFRFIILFFTATTLNFAIMLSIVLLGISAGGLLASSYFRWKPENHRVLVHLLIVNGILIILLYANFGQIIEVIQPLGKSLQIISASLFLMFPICLISGAIYTFMGKFLFLKLRDPIKSAGILTLTNTTGAMLGSAIAGLALLPLIGVEKSFFILAILYSITAFAVGYSYGWWENPMQRNRLLFVHGFFIICIAIFPFGFMKSRYLDLALPSSIANIEKRVAYKEGLTETIQYLQRDLLQHPFYHRLVTNNLSMSGTNLRSRRYMKFFVYLPATLNPSMQDVLLISYGCGSTAKALTDMGTLENIDFVDISNDVFKLSRIVYPDPKQNPINDPRVNIYIEDGRFFLTTTNQSYDLITAEPPPPKSAGIVNLYTQEYFQLIYDRLKPGGIVTYWLPVYQLHLEEAKAILKAFTNVFANNSLWTGAELDWMMVGFKDPLPKADAETFTLQWNNPIINQELVSLGFIEPGQIGTLFLGDGDNLQDWIGNTPPLVDNYPKRLFISSNRPPTLEPYYKFMDTVRCQDRFLKSRQIDQIWPEQFRAESESQFHLRINIDRLLAQHMPTISELHQCIHNKKMEPFILWAFRSDQVAQDIITNILNRKQLKASLPEEKDIIPIYRHFAARSGQAKEYALAERYLNLATERLAPQSRSNKYYYSFRAYLQFMMGMEKQAKQTLSEYINLEPTLKNAREQYAKGIWNYLLTLDNRIAGKS